MICRGQRYGRNRTFVHHQDDPLVELWRLDRLEKPTQNFAEQRGAEFVQSYYASTVRGIVGAGLDLYVSEPDWKIDAVAMTMILRLLKREQASSGAPHRRQFSDHVG